MTTCSKQLVTWCAGLTVGDARHAGAILVCSSSTGLGYSGAVGAVVAGGADIAGDAVCRVGDGGRQGTVVATITLSCHCCQAVNVTVETCITQAL